MNQDNKADTAKEIAEAQERAMARRSNILVLFFFMFISTFKSHIFNPN